MRLSNFLRLTPRKQRKADHITLQWHITDHCNLRCRHCYQQSYNQANPSFDFLTDILEQYQLLILRLEREQKTSIRGHINITGGEPFIRSDFLALLRHIKLKGLSFAILTNGSLINDSIARYLKRLAPKYVQVSIEGKKETHDAIRGHGNFASTLQALKRLKGQGLTTLVSFTAHKDNYMEFPHVAGICRELGVDRLWADRLIPSGTGRQFADFLLNQEETLLFFQQMKKERDASSFRRRKNNIAMHRALQFQVSGESIYRCQAGNELITIMPSGEVFPCRRLPLSIGNVKDKSLAEIYLESPLCNKLRNPGLVCRGCESCEYQSTCRGGLRCLSYAVTGDPFHADPGCRLASAPAAAAATTTAAPTATAT